MPNQSDPNQPSVANPPAPPMDLPPLPTDISNQPINQSTNQSTPDPGTSAPPETQPIISNTPKKKFGGGRIIATILGILLLVGGVGAGIYLTQQRQLISQKAFTLPSILPITDKCGYLQLSSISESPSCPDLNNNTGTNPVSLYQVTYTIKNVSNQPHTADITKHSNFCTDPYGEPSNNYTCQASSKDEPVTITLQPGEIKEITISRNSDTGTACGSYQTDLIVSKIDGQVQCGLDAAQMIVAAGLCKTGITCQATPPPTAPQCVSVKAYSSAWTLLSNSDLSNLAAGKSVNFCVAGSTGTFDKAMFKINSTAEPETTTKGQGAAAGDFCQNYTILSTDTTVNVKAKIHDSVSNTWVGETF